MGQLDLHFTDKVNENIDVLFLCLGHGNSAAFLAKNTLASSTIIIDLSNDFRLQKDAQYGGRTFVYGLPEINKTRIEKANAIANPGCFATAIQLALLPLANANKLSNSAHVNATTGSTGAGVSLSPTSHFTWRNNNLSWYKPFIHQHLGEIKETLSAAQQAAVELLILPHRGDFTRGIFVTAYTQFDESLAEAYALYETFYQHTPLRRSPKRSAFKIGDQLAISVFFTSTSTTTNCSSQQSSITSSKVPLGKPYKTST